MLDFVVRIAGTLGHFSHTHLSNKKNIHKKTLHGLYYGAYFSDIN